MTDPRPGLTLVPSAVAAGADLTKLSGWIVEGQDRAERIR
jgi:hypothetical protein